MELEIVGIELMKIQDCVNVKKVISNAEGKLIKNLFIIAKKKVINFNLHEKLKFVYFKGCCL